jgi:hypothetical protein
MGEVDLKHIRTVTAYGQAINARRLELLRTGGPVAAGRAAVLEMLYRLLQFSELGHNILHGSYDDLPGNGEYHSDRYDWDFNVDTTQWKVMHHEGHHPHTNIVGKDHDLGYSVLRGQGLQTLLFAGVNTDRCVFPTLQDAGFLGYDCLLLEDACSTPSPAYVSRAIHFIVRQLHGFTATAADLLAALPTPRDKARTVGATRAASPSRPKRSST